jgi:hypothetical protein
VKELKDVLDVTVYSWAIIHGLWQTPSVSPEALDDLVEALHSYIIDAYGPPF